MPRCETCSKFRCVCGKADAKRMTLEERLSTMDGPSAAKDRTHSPKSGEREEQKFFNPREPRQKQVSPREDRQKRHRNDDYVYHGFSKDGGPITVPFNTFDDLRQGLTESRYTIEQLRDVRIIRSKRFTLLHLAAKTFGIEDIDFCFHDIGIDVNEGADGVFKGEVFSEKPIESASYFGRVEHVDHLESLGATRTEAVEQKLALWDKYEHVLQNLDGFWKLVGESRITVGNQIEVCGRNATIYKDEEKVIEIPFGIFQRDTGEIGFSWKGNAWFAATIEAAGEEITSMKGDVWKRIGEVKTESSISMGKVPLSSEDSANKIIEPLQDSLDPFPMNQASTPPTASITSTEPSSPIS